MMLKYSIFGLQHQMQFVDIFGLQHQLQFVETVEGETGATTAAS
jgi:hypothetical protein